MNIPSEISAILSKVDRRKLYLGMAAALGSSAVASTVPLIYGRLVDLAVAENGPGDKILELIAVWFSLSIAADFLGRYGGKAAYETAIQATDNLQIDLSCHLINLPVEFHKNRKIGKMMKRMDKAAGELFSLIENTLFSFLPELLTFGTAFIILFFAEWRLAAILAASSSFYVFTTIFYTKKIVKKQKKLYRLWEENSGLLWDTIMNSQTVKQNTNEEFERRRINRNFRLAAKRFRNWRAIWLEMGFFQQLIFSLTFVAVFSSGIILLQAGSLSPGKLVMFVGYMSMLTSPLARLADQYRATRSAFFSLRRALKYYAIFPERNWQRSIRPSAIRGGIKFENVNFGYKRNRTLINQVCFEAEPGQMVAVVGRSGAGKSTLLSLISRYYNPLSGRILIDGIDVRRFDLKFLRQQISIVPQEVALFNDTVLNNIRYGRPEASDKEVMEAAKAANANDFIEHLPKKYEQLVGEKGLKLSSGQKQRLAIARAVLRDPRILILDEATSALDSLSEKLVQQALARLTQGRTTFIIAHRLSTVRNADKILVLSDGQVMEAGRHEELLNKENGIYRNFWELQTFLQKA